MKIPQVSGRSAQTKLASSAPVALKVFIGYAELTAFRHATAAVGEAIRTKRRKVELHPLLWRFDQMASAHWRGRTIEAALEADVVVLASSTPAGHTPAIEAWINSFLNAARGRRTTLVVISGVSDAWTISIEQPASAAKPAVMAVESAEKLVA